MNIWVHSNIGKHSNNSRTDKARIEKQMFAYSKPTVYIRMNAEHLAMKFQRYHPYVENCEI